MGNALVLTADEGRVKLRKVSGSCKEALIREYPNGEIRPKQCSDIAN